MGVHSSIRIEGGLLGPDVFDELRSGDLPGQQPIDFTAPAPVAAAAPVGDRVGEARPAYGGTERRPARRLSTRLRRRLRTRGGCGRCSGIAGSGFARAIRGPA